MTSNRIRTLEQRQADLLRASASEREAVLAFIRSARHGTERLDSALMVAGRWISLPVGIAITVLAVRTLRRRPLLGIAGTGLALADTAWRMRQLMRRFSKTGSSR